VARSVAVRVEHLEPQAEAAWRRAWEHYAATVERAIPDAVLEHAMQAPDDEAAWLDFQQAHGLVELVAWGDEHDPFPVDPDTPDLRHWPAALPAPPPEPAGAWERMHELRKGSCAAAAYASCAVLIMGLARCVRETRA
jgi:hypothetical protein